MEFKNFNWVYILNKDENAIGHCFQCRMAFPRALFDRGFVVAIASMCCARVVSKRTILPVESELCCVRISVQC